MLNSPIPNACTMTFFTPILIPWHFTNNIPHLVDHHCVWVNQCIGYNNYRHFVLMLFFFMIGCWYGVALLFHAFYEPFREQIRKHGLKWMYTNGTGVLDLPMPGTILMHLVRGDMPSKMVIDMVYPLLLGIGAVLSWFLGFHVKYILKGKCHLPELYYH